MNYLAHSFLSFSDEQIVGNMIADYVRNADREKLPAEIQRGIVMHREIDTFTDQHPIIHNAKIVFQPLVRLYSGAFVDVSMDYFLANDPTIYSEQEWKQHSEKVYTALFQHEEFLPKSFRSFLPKMASDDWLYNYRFDRGIRFSMQNVLHKAKYLEKDIPVFNAFVSEKGFLQECYDAFFPDLVSHIRSMP